MSTQRTYQVILDELTLEDATLEVTQDPEGALVSVTLGDKEVLPWMSLLMIEVILDELKEGKQV